MTIPPVSSAYADLHVHTFYSDSTFSPEEVIACAKERNIAAIAICDHDTVDGIEPCLEAARRTGIEIIAGIEITVEKIDTEIHVLGYFVDWKDRAFRDRLKELRKMRRERIYAISAKFKDAGVALDPEEVIASADKGTVGRLHVARVLYKTGKIKNIKAAFEKYIGFGKPCYMPGPKFLPREAMDTILSVGGVPVLAHPEIMGKDEYIEELIGLGLRGIEVYHTDQSKSATRRYEELAKSRRLLMTGGSDCHGMGKGRILLGETRVPYEVVERLREESKRIRKR